MQPQQLAGNWSPTDLYGHSESQIQRHLDLAVSRIERRIEQAIERLRDEVVTQIVGLRDEMRQLTGPCSNNCHANQHTRAETIPLFPNRDTVSEMRNVASFNVPGDCSADRSNTNTNIRLRFLNALRPRVYTDTKITSEDDQDVKVAMFEGDKTITSGPLSSVKVEVLVLRGEFSRNEYQDGSEEDFERHVVQGRDGQGPLLGTVRLINGEAELSQIRFKEGSCRKQVILAARVCRGETRLRVQEAIMKPVVVLDRRNESNEKRSSPKLDDDVYRLEDIARGGAYHMRLQQAEIHTVQDFLKALNKDPEKLCNILKTKSNSKSWSKMTGHARKRTLEGNSELKAYETEDGDAVLFFNCVHDLVGARFGVGDNYIACEQFNEHQKHSVKRLKERAHGSLESIPYDYVMRDDAPEPISSANSAAAGPSVVSVNAGQPNYSAEHPEAYQGCQGTGAAEIWSHEDINLVSQPVPNTHDCQGTPPPGQQQVVLPSVWPNQRRQAMFPPDAMDVVCSWEGAQDLNQTGLELSGASSASTLPNFQVEARLPQPHQTDLAAATAEMTTAAAQSLFAAVLRFQDPANEYTSPGQASGSFLDLPLNEFLLEMNTLAS